MRLVSFLQDGAIRYGHLVNGQVHELVLDASQGLRPLLSAASERSAYELRFTGAAWSLSELHLLPPINNPAKIICVGLNYREHVEETGRTPPAGYPTLFTRFADTQIGHDEPVVVPTVSHQVDYEGELAVVIGKSGRNISEETALDHIGGYACYNDVSVRDWQKHGLQWTPGKNFPGTGAFGPWLVTVDEIPDPEQLSIKTRLNGKVVQSATTGQLIFSIPFLISYISKFTELGVGDVICTGTPGGVGFTRQPPLFMKPGDVVEVEIEGVGLLSNPVTAEA